MKGKRVDDGEDNGTGILGRSGGLSVEKPFLK